MNKLTQSQGAMLKLFEQHVNAELEGDIETTMATMTDHPHLTNVPLLTGGVDREGYAIFTPIIWWANSSRLMLK